MIRHTHTHLMLGHHVLINRLGKRLISDISDTKKTQQVVFVPFLGLRCMKTKERETTMFRGGSYFKPHKEFLPVQNSGQAPAPGLRFQQQPAGLAFSAASSAALRSMADAFFFFRKLSIWVARLFLSFLFSFFGGETPQIGGCAVGFPSNTHRTRGILNKRQTHVF